MEGVTVSRIWRITHGGAADAWAAGRDQFPWRRGRSRAGLAREPRLGGGSLPARAASLADRPLTGMACALRAAGLPRERLRAGPTAPAGAGPRGPAPPAGETPHPPRRGKAPREKWRRRTREGRRRRRAPPPAGPGRRGMGVSVSMVAMAVAVVTAVVVTGRFTGALTAAAGPAAPAASRQQIAQHILRTRAAQVMTSPAQAALRMVATGNRELAT